MKKILLFTLTVLFSFNIAVQAQSTWNVDPAHAKLTFSTVHNTISSVDGLFNTFDATIISSEEDFSDAVFTLNVDVASINTQVDMRDNHLRSADFFEVETYPEMTFKSTAIKEVDENRYKLTGDLSLHGVTKTVTMDLWYRGTIENSQNGKLISGFQLTGSINRSDFGVGTGFPESLISDEVMIKADGEFKKQ